MSGHDKVFYLGFHKTGTTSFGTLAKELGLRRQSYYKPYSAVFVGKLQAEDLSELFAVADQFEAFEDDPWYLYYREFEERYSTAKFIFYERDPEAWYASALLYFGRSTTPMNELIFGKGHGSPLYNKEHQIAVYKQHSVDVRSFFSDKPEKLLEIPDLSDRSAQAIAGFLGFDGDEVRFPRMNVSRLTRAQTFITLLKLRIAKMLAVPERYMCRED
jgi:hypothetical protein